MMGLEYMIMISSSVSTFLSRTTISMSVSSGMTVRLVFGDSCGINVIICTL